MTQVGDEEASTPDADRRETEELHSPDSSPRGLTLHAVGHFHLDPVWLWDKSDGMERFRATTRSILTLMERNPEMKVAASSAAMYDYLRKVDGTMFEGIVERVREGRWEPVGGMWVEPDEHVPDGESYVRQLLLGQEFFVRYLGRPARVAWSPDSFGRYGELPRMLAGSGLEFFVFKRPERHQKVLPDLFWWTASDGSKVLTSHIREYGTWGNSLPRLLDSVVRDLSGTTRQGLVLYGVGNHGGGPTQANIDMLRERQLDPHGPRITFSTPEAYFAALLAETADFPVWSGDLEHFVAGGYSSFLDLKRAFRGVDSALFTAEAAASLRLITVKTPYPADDLRRAWQRLAFNQFHDIAAGTSMRDAYGAVFDELGGARAVARDVTIEATHAIANGIDIASMENSQALAVFNMNGQPARQFVVANVLVSDMPVLQGNLAQTYLLLDENGHEVPAQGLSVSSLPLHRLGFTVEVPPLGYRVLRLVARPDGHAPVDEGDLSATDTVLENAVYRLTLDPTTGTIASLYNKARGLEVFSGPAGCPVLVEDEGNAWGSREYNTVVPGLAFRPCAVRRTHEGPLMAAIEVEYALERDDRFTGSTLTQEFRMYHDLEYVDVRVRLFWRERRVALKLAFPIFVKVYPEATVQTPYATTMAVTDGVEVPGLAWADVAGETDFTERGEKLWHGVTVANTATYSYSFHHDFRSRRLTLSMMLARGNPYTDSSPERVSDPTAGYDLEDEGMHEMEYSIVPHMGGWREAGTDRRATDLNRPLIVMPESAHPGTLPPCASFFSVSAGNIVLGAMKEAEDGNGLILRVFEAHSRATADVRIECDGLTWTADFRPGEIKTFHLPRDGGLVTEVDLLEHPSS